MLAILGPEEEEKKLFFSEQPEETVRVILCRKTTRLPQQGKMQLRRRLIL
jgi:hypothetical protein